MSRKKQKTAEVEFKGIAHKGTSVGRTDEGLVVFVQGALPGERAEVLFTKKRKGVWQGNLIRTIRPSEYKVTAVCNHFGICGGCSWQNLDYREQLKQKELLVRDALVRIAKIPDAIIETILPATNTEFYRNKLEFTFSKHKWLTEEELGLELVEEEKLALGFHRPGNFNKVVNISRCFLQSERSNDIRNFVKEFAIKNKVDFYDIKKQQGFLRNLIIRSNTQNEYLCILSIAYSNDEFTKALKEELVHAFKEISSIYIVINPKKNDTLFDLDFQKIYGDDYITEYLDHAKFLIGPKSFFQTNSQQAAKLYQLIAAYADLKGDEIIYDWYCGVGSIGIYLAKNAAKVIGVEEIQEAIEDARLNAALNQLMNCHFYISDAKAVQIESIIQDHGLPNLIIVDPPRIGLHELVIEQLKYLKAPKLIYVSCNPATQARDLDLLKESYEVIKIKPVDMFPHTNHIESVALLSLLT
ncbi:MAG: 23S rRNA (uracil(1939)-C(5))-methyltransferase RlmD [Saprospiraceae bacterium]|nr:23S rRNA (uracil(1939)-C(5))-methyltransferase RlmD [Saprospiraceae bacterium]